MKHINEKLKYTFVYLVTTLSLISPVFGELSAPSVIPYFLAQNALQANFEPNKAIVAPTIPHTLGTIGDCESGIRLADGSAVGGSRRQFNEDGTVLRGRENPKDVGVFQINETYHLATAQSMGIDIYTEEGNIEYALYLYETQGTEPWNWSRSCWSKELLL